MFEISQIHKTHLNKQSGSFLANLEQFWAKKYQFLSFRRITNKKKELLGPQFGQLSTEISEITQIDKTHLNKQNG